MAATVGVFVYTGTNAATESGAAQTGISFLSIDSAATDLTTRQNNPVLAGSQSYSKHLRLKATVAPAVSWGNVKFWGDGSAPVDSGSGANITLMAKLAQGTGGATPGTGGTTPYNTAMTGGVNITTLTSGAKGTWDAVTYSALNTVSKELQLQLQPSGSAAPGAMGQETLSYSYDEV
jgi:hypothetical protein